LDTHAAVRQLEQAGASTALAEAMTQIIQDAVSGTPTVLELRQLVIEQDLKLERLRGEMQAFRTEMREEFGRMHTTLAQMHGTLNLHNVRISTMNRLAWAMVGLAAIMVCLTIAVAVWR
jgi:hypothetical protein